VPAWCIAISNQTRHKERFFKGVMTTKGIIKISSFITKAN